MTERNLAVRVECYAGYRGDETPIRFFLGERKIEVVQVLDRWLAPDHRYFKLQGDDGDVYIIRYDVPSAPINRCRHLNDTFVLCQLRESLLAFFRQPIDQRYG